MSTNNNHTPSVSLDAFAVGRSSTTAFLTIFETRDPTSGDVNYPVQQRWFNTALESEWILTGFSKSGEINIAIWDLISNHSAVTETLTGNSGGAVGVDAANNIFVVGDTTTINIVGNPGTHTLTASVVTGNVIVETLTGNSGGAVSPSAGNVNVVGDGTSINIVGNPGTHTLTASVAGEVATLFTEDTGTATPSSGNLIVAGAGGITTSGSGHTVTITAGGTIPTTFNEDAGSATPSGNALSIVGGANINTAGSGHTITINNSIAFSVGSFTPGLMFSGSSAGITYSSQNGQYTVVGDMCFYQLSFILTSKGAAVGTAQISGLPFPAAGPNTLSGNPQLGSITFAGNYVNIFSTSGQSFLTLEETTSGAGYTSLTNANMSDISSVSVAGFYYI